MTIEWMIPDPSEAASSRTVTIIMNQANTIRTTKVTVEPGEDIPQVVSAHLDDLYETGADVPDGLRAWFAIRQRLSNELLNQTIFAVFATMQAGGNMAAMLQAGKAVLLSDPLQAMLFGALSQAMSNASEAERLEFINLALTVAYGKLGQR